MTPHTFQVHRTPFEGFRPSFGPSPREGFRGWAGTLFAANRNWQKLVGKRAKRLQVPGLASTACADDVNAETSSPI